MEIGFFFSFFNNRNCTLTPSHLGKDFGERFFFFLKHGLRLLDTFFFASMLKTRKVTNLRSIQKYLSKIMEYCLSGRHVHNRLGRWGLLSSLMMFRRFQNWMLQLLARRVPLPQIFFFFFINLGTASRLFADKSIWVVKKKRIELRSRYARRPIDINHLSNASEIMTHKSGTILCIFFFPAVYSKTVPHSRVPRIKIYLCILHKKLLLIRINIFIYMHGRISQGNNYDYLP